MDTVSHVPPGFRFHPTDEELIDYYLRKKVASKRIDLDVIKDVDLYKIEPWDLQELCRMGMGSEDQNDWYFFSHKDKKYPTSTRTNRATKEGFWKATGRDKAIYSRHGLIGMRKTLVFYKGRAPNGQKSDWIMHEYRLETTENGTPQEEGWVVCRVFKKRMATMHKVAGDYESPYWYDDQLSFMPLDVASSPHHHHHHPCKQEVEVDQLQYAMFDEPFPHLPQPDDQVGQPELPVLSCNPIVPVGCASQSSTSLFIHGDKSHQQISKNEEGGDNEVMDWRAMDRYVASQLSIDRDDDQNKGSKLYYSHAAGLHIDDQPDGHTKYASE